MVTQFVFLFLACAIVGETSTEMAVKTVDVVVEMESKVQNFAAKPQWNRSPELVVTLEFWTFDVNSVVDKSTDHE